MCLQVLAFVVVALACVAFAEEEKKTEKRGLLGLGYGAAGYGAGLGYGGYGLDHGLGNKFRGITTITIN